MSERTALENIPDNEFHLGFTMAGAISAGCYTGGTMDYFFEMMDLWEKAKSDPASIGLTGEYADMVPKHKVIVDVMGGASAGGMATAMAGLHALQKERKPISNPLIIGGKRGNVFYDSWVLLDDSDANQTDQRHTFIKMWDTDDIESEGNVSSLLNSKVLDSIAGRAYTTNTANPFHYSHLPAYIANDFEILLSLASVRGIPLDVDFATPIRLGSRLPNHPTHTTWEHYILAHFKISKEAHKDNDYLWFNPNDAQACDVMKLSTIATGAFPVGLRFREFSSEAFPKEYIQKEITRIVLRDFGPPDYSNNAVVVRIRVLIESNSTAPQDVRTEMLELTDGLPITKQRLRTKLGRSEHYTIEEKKNIIDELDLLKDAIDFTKMPEPFFFTAVDGGSINNEPYGEVLEVLKARHGECAKDPYKKYGVVMIDPFPDRAQKDDLYKAPKSILSIAPKIIGMLKNQSRVKRKEMLDGFSDKYMRGVIFPKKWVSDKDTDPWPIASECFAAFGGFLDIRFRHHDFFLGRNNARTFFRFFFTVEYDEASGKVHPIHKSWTPAMIDAFKVESPRKSGKYFLPIVPDMRLLLEKQNNQPIGWRTYDIPEKPKYNPEQLFSMLPAIEKRLGLVVEKMTDELTGDDTPIAEVPAEVQQWLDAYFRKGWFKRLLSRPKKWIMELVLNRVPGRVAAPLAEWVVKWIIKDLHEKGLLEKKL